MHTNTCTPHITHHTSHTYYAHTGAARFARELNAAATAWRRGQPKGVVQLGISGNGSAREEEEGANDALPMGIGSLGTKWRCFLDGLSSRSAELQRAFSCAAAWKWGGGGAQQQQQQQQQAVPLALPPCSHTTPDTGDASLVIPSPAAQQQEQRRQQQQQVEGWQHTNEANMQPQNIDQARQQQQQQPPHPAGIDRASTDPSTSLLPPSIQTPFLTHPPTANTDTGLHQSVNCHPMPPSTSIPLPSQFPTPNSEISVSHAPTSVSRAPTSRPPLSSLSDWLNRNRDVTAQEAGTPGSTDTTPPVAANTSTSPRHTSQPQGVGSIQSFGSEQGPVISSTQSSKQQQQEQEQQQQQQQQQGGASAPGFHRGVHIPSRLMNASSATSGATLEADNQSGGLRTCSPADVRAQRSQRELQHVAAAADQQQVQVGSITGLAGLSWAEFGGGGVHSRASSWGSAGAGTSQQLGAGSAGAPSPSHVQNLLEPLTVQEDAGMQPDLVLPRQQLHLQHQHHQHQHWQQHWQQHQHHHNSQQALHRQHQRHQGGGVRTPVISAGLRPSASPEISVGLRPSASPVISAGLRPSASPEISAGLRPSAFPEISAGLRPSASQLPNRPRASSPPLWLGPKMRQGLAAEDSSSSSSSSSSGAVSLVM